MRIGDDVGHRVDASGRDFGGLQRGQHLIDGQTAGPVGDGGVEQVALGCTPVVVGELRGLGQIGAADGLHQALVDRIAVAGDHHVGAVGRQVGVGRRDARQGTTAAFAHMTKHVVFRHQAFHDVEHAFGQGHINDLPAALPGLDP
ncbi:hypothetical protein D9M71_353660 [compost metagenome]